MSFEKKPNYKFEDLIEIMKLLRAPNGCPWDKEQTHESIRQNFIEETYEVIEAIDTKDKELLKEELGDVLLQVVFHSEMESEIGSFNIDDVCDGICKKLIIRHPHIFADVTADTTEEVLNNWDKIKMQTKLGSPVVVGDKVLNGEEYAQIDRQEQPPPHVRMVVDKRLDALHRNLPQDDSRVPYCSRCPRRRQPFCDKCHNNFTNPSFSRKCLTDLPSAGGYSILMITGSFCRKKEDLPWRSKNARTFRKTVRCA